MPAKSSSSAPKTRRRKKTTDEEPEKDVAATDKSSDDGDFGEGLDEPKPKPKRKRAAKKKTEDDVESNGKARKKEKAEASADDAPAGDDTTGSDADGGEASSESSGDSEGEGGQRRRRRRRRRGGRKNDGDNQNQNQNRQRGGRRNQNNRGNNRGGGRQQKQRTPYTGEVVTGPIEGVLELHPKGYGFIRDPKKDYSSQDSDPFVSSSIIEKHRLREGVMIKGEVGPGSRGQGPRLKDVESVDGRTLEEYEQIKDFEDLTPINPFEQIRLERGKRPIPMRVMDLITPIGKGQRALIVAPPRTGKTMLLQDIAESISENHPEVHLMVLLIDERPEEVTEMRRGVRGEVIASSMDREVESHVRMSQLVMERAKRLSEAGKDVVVLLDSVTRTARAFNKWVGNSGKTGSGGLDVRAMDIPRKMFGTARRFDEGGSLTVIATALIDTGSRMDEAIFQEFKGTGNMELVLSRDLADRRIWPAIDITKSGTRREEKILGDETLDGTIMLRRSLVSLSPVEAMEQLTQTLARFDTNKEFLAKIRQIL